MGDAYAIPCPPATASLITTAQAAHWLDMPRFLAEAQRVLQPRGWLAIIGYGACRLHPSPAQAVFASYYDALGSRKPPGAAGCYWDCDRRILDSGHAGLTVTPYLREASVVRDWFEDTRTLSLDQLDGYLRTWSAYRTYCTLHPTAPDIVSRAMEGIREAVGEGAGTVDVTFPFFLVTVQRD